jgi:hypothetical protein
VSKSAILHLELRTKVVRLRAFRGHCAAVLLLLLQGNLHAAQVLLELS